MIECVLKVERLFWRLQGDFQGIEDPFSGWNFGKWKSTVHCGDDDGWRWAEGATGGSKHRGFKDPTCGSDLTLHPVQVYVHIKCVVFCI
jgi:hypothetical protein